MSGYTFGSNQFSRILRFEEAVLVKITMGEKRKLRGNPLWLPLRTIYHLNVRLF